MIVTASRSAKREARKNWSYAFSSVSFLFFPSAVSLSQMYSYCFPKDTPRVSHGGKEFTLSPNVGKQCAENTFTNVDALAVLDYYFHVN